MIGTIFLHFIIAMIATLAFAVLFQAPKSEWGLCGLTGGVGWFVYEYLHSQQGWHLMLATIVATLALTLLSRFFAVLRKHPADAAHPGAGHPAQSPGNGLSADGHFPAGAGSRDLLCSLLSNQR